MILRAIIIIVAFNMAILGLKALDYVWRVQTPADTFVIEWGTIGIVITILSALHDENDREYSGRKVL